MADVIIGLFSPYRYGIMEYFGYDITKWQDNIRFMEIIAGREGGGGTLSPLYFDGGVNFFAELPKPTETNDIQKVLREAEKSRSGQIFFMMHKF